MNATRQKLWLWTGGSLGLAVISVLEILEKSAPADELAYASALFVGTVVLGMTSTAMACRYYLNGTDARAGANPPALAEWLVTLIIRRRSENLLGDLEERFHRHVETRGLRRARWLYWAEVLKSILPILWAKARSLGLIAAIAEIWRRAHS